MGIDNIERPGLSERDKLPLNDFEVMAEIYAEPSRLTAAADMASLRCNHV